MTDVSISRLPMTDNSDGEEVLSLYWIDAFEDYFKHPGMMSSRTSMLHVCFGLNFLSDGVRAMQHPKWQIYETVIVKWNIRTTLTVTCASLR